MAVNKTDFYDWSQGKKADKLKYRKASPNLIACKDYLIKRFGGTSVGIFARRNKRGSVELSTHYFGAALDWRYTTQKAADSAASALVRYSKEWGIQMIVDYVGCRIWTPKSGWKPVKPNAVKGYGQAWAKWFHIETTKTEWGNATPFVDRVLTGVPAQK